MKENIEKIFADSIKAKSDFVSDEKNVLSVVEAANAISGSLSTGGKVLIFGNGGSAADSQHMAAELVVRFEKERVALPAIALTTDSSILTACANDYDFDNVFSRQVDALAGSSDIVLAISTSGNSPNVINGVRAARSRGLVVIALTGRDGGELASLADIVIMSAVDNTARIQEVHNTVIHAICKIVEEGLSK